MASTEHRVHESAGFCDKLHPTTTLKSCPGKGHCRSFAWRRRLKAEINSLLACDCDCLEIWYYAQHYCQMNFLTLSAAELARNLRWPHQLQFYRRRSAKRFYVYWTMFMLNTACVQQHVHNGITTMGWFVSLYFVASAWWTGRCLMNCTVIGSGRKSWL